MMIFQFSMGSLHHVFSKAFGSFRSFAVGTCRTALPRLPSGTEEICLGSAGWRPARGETGEIGEIGETDTSSSLISVFHSFTTFENHWRSEKYRFNASPHLWNLLTSGAAGSQLWGGHAAGPGGLSGSERGQAAGAATKHDVLAKMMD